MAKYLIRNLFDQYDWPENRLTHALVHVLAENRRLTRHFIMKFAPESSLARGTNFSFSCQRLPGEEKPQPDEEEEAERRGLPDAWIYDDTRSTVVLECKITAGLTINQLVRHASTIRTKEFNEAHLLVITAHEKKPRTVTKVERGLLGKISCSWASWPDIYEFFDQHSGSYLESEFVNYLRVLEGKLMADGYDGPPLIKFSGIPFGPNYPYNEPEAKGILRALRAKLIPELAASRILPKIDESTPPKPMTGPWVIVTFAFASGFHFTKHPHLSIVLPMGESDWKGIGACWIQLVLPHSANGEYWKRIRSCTEDRFVEVLENVANRIRPLLRRFASDIWRPRLTLALYQRHFRGQQTWTRDGLLQFDVNTLLDGKHSINSSIRQVPGWLQAAHTLLVDSRRANFELALRAQFPLSDGSVSRRADFVGALVKSAEAFQPFLALLRNKEVKTRA